MLIPGLYFSSNSLSCCKYTHRQWNETKLAPSVLTFKTVVSLFSVGKRTHWAALCKKKKSTMLGEKMLLRNKINNLLRPLLQYTIPWKWGLRDYMIRFCIYWLVCLFTSVYVYIQNARKVVLWMCNGIFIIWTEFDWMWVEKMHIYQDNQCCQLSHQGRDK